MPGGDVHVEPGEMAVPYYLVNQGTGPAFNVDHGIDDASGRPLLPPTGLLLTIGAGEEYPRVGAGGPQGETMAPLIERVAAASADEIVHWTRFENLLGQPFEVRSYRDYTRPAQFRRL